MNAVIDVIVGFLKAANAILSVVPGLVWAVALVVAASWGGAMHHERNTAQAERDAAVGAKRQIEGQLKQQKKEAADKLAQLTKERDAAQALYDQAHNQLEADSEKRRNDSKAASAALAADAARHGGQLRDPAGCGRSGASPQGQAAAPAADRAGDPATTSGLLSEPLTRLLQWVAGDAQRQADAYAASRADTLTCRAAQGAAP